MAGPTMNQPHPLEAINKTSYRIDSIDLLRGLVMIIMALDHSREFFHKDGFTGDPLNLATTTPFLYFTRWITHFCAPVFVFLAGTSVYFQSRRKSKKELSMFLFKRGIWLLIVEIFIMNFAFSFDIHYSLIALQTIWSIAISMIILGLVIWLPFTAILITGSLIVLGHNALDFYEAGLKSRPGLFYSLLHVPGPHPLWDGHTLLVLYPFLAWSGLMMMGYCLGRLFLSVEGQQRKKMLIRLGLCIIIFFIALRYSNKYGNPFTWHTQKNLLFTFLDFMNVQKYPPSLLFMCATIGPALIFLAFTENIKNGLTRFIMVYGRVPFFYYILHFYLIHLISSLLYLSRGHSIAEGIHTNTTGFFQPNFLAPGEGYSLAAVYGLWLFVVLSLYPLCKWFSRYKQTHSYWWLSYL